MEPSVHSALVVATAFRLEPTNAAHEPHAAEPSACPACTPALYASLHARRKAVA